MLDIQFIRDNPELVAEKSKQKGYTVDVHALLAIDNERRELLQQVEGLRARRNDLSGQMKNGKPEPAIIEQSKQLKEELGVLEAQLEAREDERLTLLQAIPNAHFDDVPVGGEELGEEVKKVGGQPTGATDHLDFAIARDWVDFERGAKVAGAKFYFLKGELALLENALIQYGIDFITSKGFRYMTVPHMVNTRVAAGAGFAPRGHKESNEYFVEGEELTMIGTSEAPLTGYHADEIIDEDKLPLLYAGLSPCYRKEAGTYGKHTRGLFRVHQFNKLEMYAFVTPEQSKDMHEKILALEEEFWQSIGIPYHIINIASGDLGAPAAKKYDIEYWSPVDASYRELTSCSNCTDFQARNLNIRVRRGDGSVEMLHTLNGTVVSLARALVVLLENFQTDDAKLAIPKVLQQYMQGRETI